MNAYLLRTRLSAIVLLLSLCPAGMTQDKPTIEEIVITATLMSSDRDRMSSDSLTAADLSRRAAIHFEDVLTALPNVAASAGASRQRFFQIRGIGERSQFIEPINPSVVILQDGVDISGIGSALTTFDTAQIDVLRGPQGTLMGAGALAGLINLQNNMPAETNATDLAAGLENFGGRRSSIVVNRPVSPTLSARIAHQNYRSNGWVDNTHLGVNDTNNRDETTTRLSIRQRYDRNTIDIGVSRIDVANGYDAFSLDNTRETLSDNPGEDRLALDVGFVRWNHEGDRYESQLQASSVRAESRYSYDEDWSFVGIAPFWEYSSFDAYDRDVERQTLEWRLRPVTSADTQWTVGLYVRDDSQKLKRQYTYLAAPFESTNTTQTWAAFGQASQQITDQLVLTAGVRAEYRDVDYRDSAAVDTPFSDRYWTGNASIEWTVNDRNALYITLSRGVRAGGFNATLSSTLLSLTDEINIAPYTDNNRFGEEAVVNTELGWRASRLNGDLRTVLTVFNMARSNQQVKSSLVIPRADGSTSFTDFTDNAASGTNQGLEGRLDWNISQDLAINAGVGLLEAAFDRYINVDGTDLSGRDQPQAPSWQYRLGATLALTPALNASLEVTGRDSFFLSDRHNVKSPTAELINVALAWTDGPWSLTIWGRNMTDELTITRGFGTFGNDPRKEYALEPYYQFGEPRTVGATVGYRFGD
ncbi:TonB-dependent receptor [Luminiphilus sp.]|nr:TonB-dependent receptor [Luminiphilus sp.]